MTKTENTDALSSFFHILAPETKGVSQTENGKHPRPADDVGNPRPVTHTFFFRAESTLHGDTWQREGRGTAKIVPEKVGLRLLETGHWIENGSGESIRFTASWEFQPLPEGGIEVAHNRTGPATPLVHLFPTGENTWASRSPHLCGEDRYHACLTRNPDGGFRLEWTATGPRKQYRLLREYSAPEIPPPSASPSTKS